MNKKQCLTAIGQDLTNKLEHDINKISNKLQTQKCNTLQKKIAKITPQHKTTTLTHGSKTYPIERYQKRRKLYSHMASISTTKCAPGWLLANLESILKTNNLDHEMQEDIRQRTIPNIQRNRHNRSQPRMASTKNLKKEKSIVILPTDKSRCTIIMNKTATSTKLRTYCTTPASNTILKQNEKQPNEDGKSKANNFHRKEISATTRSPRYLSSRLPKMHKNGILLRPIVALPGAPTYKLVKALQKTLSPRWWFDSFQWTLNNSFN